MNNPASLKLSGILDSANISHTAISALGRFVHIDTFENQSLRLQSLLIDGGFEILRANGGQHLDGFNGFRVSAKVRKAA